MEQLQQRQISVVEPIGAAIEKTKEILFRPFDIGKWFTIGFCAWLATFGEGGGVFNFRSGGCGDGTCGQTQNFQDGLESIKNGFIENLVIIIPVAVLVFLVILFLVLVLMWLNSRGQFMFLHCVTRNVAQVKVPWKRYAAEGDSLYRFKLVLWLASMVFGVLIIVPIVLLIIPMVKTDFGILMVAPIVAIVFLVLLAIIAGFAFGIVTTMTKDFVVPVMYLRGCTVTEAWKSFWSLCRENKGVFALYILFLIVVSIALGVIAAAVVMAACCLCCVGIIFMIPYIGTVAMLPLLVWRRAYSALFLAQFGPEYDVFATADPVVVPETFMPPTSPEQNF